MAASSARVIVEYAKSGRAACKVCYGAIPVKSIRMGVVTRDPHRGFDQTKWHHLNCFRNLFPSSTDFISGFDLLQNGDQESLRNMLAHSNDAESKALDGIKQDSEKRKNDDNATQLEMERRESKAIKLSTDDGEVKVGLSFPQLEEKYKDAILPPQWKAYQTVIFLEQDDGLRSSNKVAAFDFDGCLAKTFVRRIGADAWSLMYPSIPDKLQGLYNDGYKLVIFTNESNIDRWKNKRQVAVDSKVGRLNNFLKCVKVPIQIFIACGYSVGKVEDLYRKPNPGMWQIMEKYFNSGISVDMDQSFFVGDAAGRDGDHSDADVQFAKAIGLKFHVPEDFFCQ